jgi:DNA-binding NtrC family response regulator
VPRRLLLVEDRESLRRMLEQALGREGYEVVAAADAVAGRRCAESEAFDLVLTDLRLPGGSGLDVLAASRRARPATPVVVLTAYGSVATAVEAMKAGAADFLEKPVELEDLYRLVARLVGSAEAPDAFTAPGVRPIVGRHPRLRAALHLLERVAPTDSTVLLLGESGTGKELFARALHALSPRAAGPFVALNCAAIPESLIENELFGHERGAFTGADRRQAGRFELARGGTLLLDEIGELPLPVQGKVLRVLEERAFERVGGGATLAADVRLIAATNRRLAAMVEAGEFRSDLFFRLDVFPIELPPLRERATDIPLLARHLLAELAARHALAAPELDPAAAELLAGEAWPGNIRQLAHVLERAVILGNGGRLGVADVQAVLGSPAATAGHDADPERARLRAALLASDGDKRRAAEQLGISYRTLQRRVRELDLEGFPKYRG